MQPRNEMPIMTRPYRKVNRMRAVGNQIRCIQNITLKTKYPLQCHVFVYFRNRFLRRLQHSLRAKARSQQDCISSRSCTDDDDESMLSDSLAPPQQTAIKMSPLDTIDSPSITTQSKSTDSYSPPPNVIHTTKTTRSLSLNASHVMFDQTKSVRTDAYLDEINSD